MNLAAFKLLGTLREIGEVVFLCLLLNQNPDATEVGQKVRFLFLLCIGRRDVLNGDAPVFE